MHAWGVYSFIKRAQAVYVNLAVLAEKLGYVAWLLYAIPLYLNHSYYLISKMPPVIYRKSLCLLISI